MLSAEEIKAELESKSPEGFHWGNITESEIEKFRIILAKASDYYIKKQQRQDFIWQQQVENERARTLKEVGEWLLGICEHTTNPIQVRSLCYSCIRILIDQLKQGKNEKQR